MRTSRTTARRTAATGLAVALTGVGLSVATAGNANADVWDAVAQCESGGNWGISTGNGFYGGLQFTQSTWRAYGGSGSPQGASAAQQKAVAKRVLQGQGPGAWPVCSRKAGLTRGNGGSASAASVSSSRSTTRHAVKVTTSKRTSTVTTKRTVLVAPKAAHKHAVAQTTKQVVVVAPTTHRAVTKTTKTVVAPSLRMEVKQIQRALDVRVDGVVGPQTARAIQAYVGASQDGVIGRQTVAALEKKLGLKASGASTLRPSRIAALANALAR